MQSFYEKGFKLKVQIDKNFYKNYMLKKVKFFPIFNESVTGF